MPKKHNDKRFFIVSLAVSTLIHAMLIVFLAVTFTPVRNQDLRIDVLNDFHQPVAKETGSDRKSVSIKTGPAQPIQIAEEPQTEPLVEPVLPRPLAPDELLLNSSNLKMKKWSIEHPLHADSMNRRVFAEQKKKEHSPLLPMGKLTLRKKSREFSLFPPPPVKKPDLDFIPSNLELDVLCEVWQQDSISDQQIYTALDTSLRMTAEDLNQTLTRLTDKGLLNRKIISPQHKFKFFILPEDRFGMEVSAMNRRNRVYQYSSNINFREVLNFLNAAAYNTGELQQDSIQTAQTIRGKIIRMLEKVEN